ncbi:MAG: sulfotransferase [Candidatus Pelagibacter sp.]|nr:sulfotransferase [Candidatus Pelagibacter sp.]
MIIWIASYPKSGNTWIRSLLSSYLFSDNGKFNFKLLKNIEQFSSKNLSLKFQKNLSHQTRISKNWIPSQKIINQDNKIRFFKTHNAMCAINGNKFTDKFNTLAAIYVVRDPRNLITSLANHYELNLDETFSFLTNKRKIIFPINRGAEKKDIKENEDFNFLGDWSAHYQSWKNINFCPIKIIKYEDLLTDVQKVFVSTLDFLSKFLKIKFDKKKINTSLISTSFKNLSQMEKNEEFQESVTSFKTDKKIKFFNLGKKNNWKNLLDPQIEKKIREVFSKEMKELGYN